MSLARSLSVALVLAPLPALASWSESYERAEPEQRPPAQAELVVPAELARLSFSVKVINPELDRALYSVKAASDELLKRAKAAAGPGATLRLRNLGTQSDREKSFKSSTPVQYALEGELEVALPAGDFFARARIVAALENLSRELESSTRDFKPGYLMTFGQVESRVKDPEVHRATLLKLWNARAKELVEAASGQGAQLSGCDVPGRVAQRTAAMEEVELTLEVSCKLSFNRGAK